jgi:hypothetical protein
MKNTLTASAAGADEQAEAMAVTPLGKLLVVLVLLGGGFSAWKFGPTILHAWTEPTNAAHANVEQRTSPVTLEAAASAAHTAEKQQSAQATQASPEQAQRDHLMLVAVAGRALAEQNRQRIVDLDSTLQGLDEKLGVLEAQKPSSVIRAAREQAAAAVKTVHATAAAVKEAASVDVAALPVETVSAASIGIANLTKGAVSLAGGQQVAVGRALRSGETVVAVDPESHAIVTNRRIINVTN